MFKKALFIWLFACYAITGMAQSLEIVQSFRKIENSSAVVLYHNQFGQYEKPQMDDSFPYAVVRVLLEGNVHEVTAAKKMLGIYTGVLSQGLKASYLDFENEILFLVPSSSGHVELSCGDGCARQTILELPKLESNALYMGKVHYRPAAPMKDNTEGPESQFFKFRVTPQTSVVTLVIDGQEENIPMRGEGIASTRLKYGTYQYRVTAERYYTEEGTITVSSSQTDMSVTLRPRFGWLTIKADNTSQGAFVFATNTQTNVVKQLGTLPLSSKEMDSGEYTLRIQKEKYKDYTTAVTIKDGETTTLSANLLPNFAHVTLTTNSGAEILLDGTSMGRGSWSGTIELGEHSVETRQTSHRSAYTTININAQSAGRSIALNNPVPIYGSLLVDGSPVDASVYVDGRKVGNAPTVVNKLLVGSHQVRIEKEGYAKQEKPVQITEGQEAVMEYTLTKEDVKKSVVATTPQGTAIETFTVNGVSFNMIKVQGGTFTMGATSEQGSEADSDEKPTHQVTLSDYMIGETEVTQELWQAVKGSNPSDFSGTNLPVERVSWNDCHTFITKLNELTGKTFRLPTEAEWEYAARGGNKSKGYKYAGSNTLSDVAWYTDNSGSKTHTVKLKQANELGLYDMSGNVWEWCQDWYGSYSSAAQTNPTGPTSGSDRVLRGGSWNYNARRCRVSYRNYNTPTITIYYLGLRLAL
jgi:formylglycine-generating enzyme required for sulfatase activity